VDSVPISRVESLLRRAEVLLHDWDESLSVQQLHDVYSTICELVLDAQFIEALWHEPVLSQLNRLFDIKPPSSSTFGHLLESLEKRGELASRINDLFFSVLNNRDSAEDVYRALSLVCKTDQSFIPRLAVSGVLDKVRASDETPSAKLTTFFESLRDDLGTNLLEDSAVKHCLASLRQREGIGRVNALLVTPRLNRYLSRWNLSSKMATETSSVWYRPTTTSEVH
jgi:hypothetical protein